MCSDKKSCSKGCSTTRKGAWVLVLVGAFNWGLVGAFNFDLVAAIFGGGDSLVSRAVYTLVGISAIMLAAGCAKCKKMKGGCSDGSCGVVSEKLCKGDCKGEDCKTCPVE